MPRASLAGTTGYLEGIVAEDRALRLWGWCGTEDGPSVDGFRAFAAGRWLEITGSRRGLPSPEIAAIHPGLADAGACRFELVAASEPGDPERIGNGVAIVVPMCGSTSGRALLRLLQPVLPLPSPAIANRVGCDRGFLDVAREFLGYAVTLAHLDPAERVLDVGCGLGRVAYAFVQYLAPTARYEGFDVVEDLVRWANETITPRFPNFRFRTLALRNSWYAPKARLEAERASFPYDDGGFGLVLLVSVFTHLRAATVRRYLAETRRVLRPGGGCLATAFLLDEESRALVESGRSSLAIVHPFEAGLTINRKAPEQAIAHPSRDLLEWVEQAGLVVGGIFPGSWCGRTRFTSYQDLLLLRRP